MAALPTFSELLPFVAVLLAVGAFAGLLAGLFGIGGGAVFVPVFYQMLGIVGVDESIRMHLAVGTSLAIIVPTSIRSFQAHKAKGAVDMDLLRSFLIVVPVGVVMASIAAAYLSSEILRAIFAFFTLIIALKMLLGKDSWTVAGDIPGGIWRGIAGWAIGFFSTFMGIGGGVFNNTFMTTFGRPIHQAVATSSGLGVLISIPGAIGYLWAGWGVSGLPFSSVGYINLLMVVIAIPMSLIAAPIGAGLAHRLKKRQLEIIFGIFLVIVALRFFASLV